MEIDNINSKIKTQEKISIDQEKYKTLTNIIFDDENIVCVNKPANEYIEPPEEFKNESENITTTNDNNNTKRSKFSIMEALAIKYKKSLTTEYGEEAKPKTCHRIDYPTSGILLYGLKKQPTGAISRSFQERKIHKAYLALLYGHVNKNQYIDMDIGKDTSDSTGYRMTCNKDTISEPRRALTEMHIISRGFYSEDKNEKNKIKVTLVMYLPYTGRTHQLRVHSALIGHSIVGDLTYRNTNETGIITVMANNIQRLFLHAWLLKIETTPKVKRIKFPQYNGKTFEAPVPPEFFENVNYSINDVDEVLKLKSKEFREKIYNNDQKINIKEVNTIN